MLPDYKPGLKINGTAIIAAPFFIFRFFLPKGKLLQEDILQSGLHNMISILKQQVVSGFWNINRKD